MSTEDSTVSGVAGRYASALFDLAKEAKSVDEVADALSAFTTAIEDSDDLKRLVRSPAFSADDQLRALTAVLDKAKVGGLTANFLKLVTRNRRLFVVEDMVRGFHQMVAQDKGEVTADVTSAQALKPAQVKSLQTALKSVVSSKSITIRETVDPSILGGLIVKVGSRMIDTSLKTKLNALKIRMKEVG